MNQRILYRYGRKLKRAVRYYGSKFWALQRKLSLRKQKSLHYGALTFATRNSLIVVFNKIKCRK